MIFHIHIYLVGSVPCRLLRQHRDARGTTRSSRDPSAPSGLLTRPQDDIASFEGGWRPLHPCFTSANIAFYFLCILLYSIFYWGFVSGLTAKAVRFVFYILLKELAVLAPFMMIVLSIYWCALFLNLSSYYREVKQIKFDEEKSYDTQYYWQNDHHERS